MSDSSPVSGKARPSFRHAYAGFADAGILMSLAAALGSGCYAIASGSAPHWAAVAGTAVCAAYLSVPGVRALGRGMPGPELPVAVLAAAEACAVRAV